MPSNIKRSRARKLNWTAIGFVIAFLLSTATVIYTGLLVKAPGTHRPAGGGEAAVARDDTASAASVRHAVTDSAAARLPMPESEDEGQDKRKSVPAPRTPAEAAE